MGKLIIIEGLDGCGKSTQTKLLEEYFEKNSINFKKIKLPDYDSESSTLVKMYLAGGFGKDAADVMLTLPALFMQLTGLRLISLIGATIIITEH